MLSLFYKIFLTSILTLVIFITMTEEGEKEKQKKTETYKKRGYKDNKDKISCPNK